MTAIETLTNETNREMAELRHEVEVLTRALAESRRLHQVTDLAAIRRAWQAFQDARGSDEIAVQADLLDDLLGVDCEGTVLGN